jgi:O-antigen ligase
MLLLAGAVAALALVARFVPEGRPFLVLPVGVGALLLGRRSFHLGAAFYFLMLPFLDLLPRQISGIPAINPRNLMLVALLGLLVLQSRRPSPGTEERRGGAVLALAVVVFAWMLVGVPIAYQSHSIPVAISLDTWLNMAAVVVPLVLGVAVVRQGPRQRRFLAGALLVAVTLVSTWAFIGHAAKVAGGGDPTRLRSAGMLGQANSFGAFLALALPGFLTLFAGSFRPLARALGAAGSLLCLACLATTLSRGSILAAGAGFLVLGLLRHRALLVGGIVLALFAGPWLLPTAVSERFNETFVGQEGTEGLDNSAYTRLEMYRAAPEVFRNAPIIGHGLGAYPSAAFRVGGQNLARSPHSWYILVATEFGAIGTLLYGAWTLSIVAALWRQRSSPSYMGAALSNALLASTAALAVICFFQKPFVDNELILPFYFAGVGLAIGAGLPAVTGAAAGPRPLAAR